MNRIKELISLNCITSKELSEETGIPYDSLKNYEYGRREPTGSALVALEEYFGVPGAYILGTESTKGKLADSIKYGDYQAVYHMAINKEMNSYNRENHRVHRDISRLLISIIREIEYLERDETEEILRILLSIIIELDGIMTLDVKQKKFALEFIRDSVKNLRQFLCDNEDYNLEK
ncbi:MAG: helix-turn-helix transcriptional regulator [Anaerovoracaceae bacterium]